MTLILNFSITTTNFPTKNSLVVAIKSKKEIDKNLLNEIDNLSLKITKLDKVSSVFNINKSNIIFK